MNECLNCAICEYEQVGECLYRNQDCFDGCEVCEYCRYEEDIL